MIDLTPTTRRRLVFLAAALILLLALFLRVRALETTTLWGDQAFTLNTAMRWVNGGDIPLAANKSSVGFVNPPMIEYLQAAALRVWPDILSVSWLTLLGGLLAIAVTGYATARIFGARAGLWAMLTFAVAPWAIFWSQQIWNQTMVPPFAALALGSLLLYIAGPPRWYWLLITFGATAVMTQVHPGTAVQMGTIGIVLLLFRRRVNWWHVAAGAGLFALLYVPYLLYQVGTGWADIRAMGELAGEAATFSPAAALLSLDLVRAQGLFRSIPRTALADAIITGLFLASLALTIGRGVAGWRRDRQAGPEAAPGAGTGGWAAVLIILLWFAMPLLFYLRSSVYLQNYYLLGQWPAHFMIFGIGLDTAHRLFLRLARQSDGPVLAGVWKAAVWLMPILLLAVAAFQVSFTLRYQDARAFEPGGGIQVGHARELIAEANALLAERPDCRLVAFGRGHQVENSSVALLQEFTDPSRILLADGDMAAPLPAPCAVYLDARPGTLATYWLEATADPLPDSDIELVNQTWRFFERTDLAPAAVLPEQPQWDNGLALIGYERGEFTAGAELPLILTWAITRDPAEPYHFGVYLLTADDQIVAQQDGPGFDSVQWRPGDQFVTWFRLPLPEALADEPYRLATALYTWPELERSVLQDGSNTAYLEEVRPTASP